MALVQPINSSGWAKYAPLLPLFGLLLGVYCFTYSSNIESGDTRVFFNATASLVRFGDVLLDITASTSPPDPTISYPSYPLASASPEPLQLVLPSPLYWLAYHLPGIGLVHAVWLFNIFISIAIAGVIYIYALSLNYRVFIAIIASLSIGLFTVTWPYSRTFFREPLATLMILLTAYFFQRWRSTGYHSLLCLFGAVLSLLAAWLTKEAVIFAIPALLVVVAPTLFVPPLIRRWGAVLMLVGIIIFFALLLLSVFLPPSFLQSLYSAIAPVLHRSPAQISTAHLALHTYLLSIGGSIWGTSPILLLAVPGLFLLVRRRQYRYPVAVSLMVLTFACGYAILRDVHWFGGLSWPPRFMLPVIPFLVLGLLPFVEKLFNRPRARYVGLLAGVVYLYSLWVQLSGVTVRLDAYIAALPPQANGLIEWGGGLNDINYLRWVVIPSLWGRIPFDFAWARVDVIAWPVVCAAVVAISGIWIWQLLSSFPPSIIRSKWIYAVSPLVLGLLLWLGLRAINFDDLYAGSNLSLRNLLPLFDANSRPGDILLLSDNEYEPFFMNNGKVAHARVISLPDPPGERPSPEVQPLITSPNPDALLVKSTVPLIHNLAKMQPTLWLLSDFGPWHTWAVRPVERFMAMHYFPIRELEPTPADPRVRLIEYSTINAPDPFDFRGPDVLTDFRFGSSIRLLGISIPAGNAYHAGDIVALSLYWQSEQKIEQNFTVAWFVADESGTVVAQGVDTQPVAGFEPTTSWQPRVPLWDNRAMRLPAEMRAGTYQLWIRLYQSDASEAQLLVKGAQVLDGTIAVLPLNIEIMN
ncbi:MAG: hypothetical protein R3E39_02860 [Anaerolineae bacterium]